MYVFMYKDGTSPDVQRLKKSVIFTPYTLGFLDHLHFLLQ